MATLFDEDMLSSHFAEPGPTGVTGDTGITGSTGETGSTGGTGKTYFLIAFVCFLPLAISSLNWSIQWMSCPDIFRKAVILNSKMLWGQGFLMHARYPCMAIYLRRM